MTTDGCRRLREALQQIACCGARASQRSPAAEGKGERRRGGDLAGESGPERNLRWLAGRRRPMLVDDGWRRPRKRAEASRRELGIAAERSIRGRANQSFSECTPLARAAMCACVWERGWRRRDSACCSTTPGWRRRCVAFSCCRRGEPSRVDESEAMDEQTMIVFGRLPAEERKKLGSCPLAFSLSG